MGLLDDAIREHLELKRRRGADAEELARQEDEALGDPRSAAPAEDAAPGAAEGQAVAESETVPAEPAAVVEEPPAPPEADQETAPAEPAGAVAAGDQEPSTETWLEDDDDRIGSIASQRTAEFTPPDVEPSPEPEPEPEEDVLEETPEFLQETPEHDRLWFEQKPPRDFDFDN